MFKEYPWNSSYAFSENFVIAGTELEGLEMNWRIDGDEILETSGPNLRGFSTLEDAVIAYQGGFTDGATFYKEMQAQNAYQEFVSRLPSAGNKEQATIKASPTIFEKHPEHFPGRTMGPQIVEGAKEIVTDAVGIGLITKASKVFRLWKASRIARKTAGSIKNVNKTIDGRKLGSQNCTNCVISTDLALQGVKSTALPKALSTSNKYVDGPVSISVLEKYYDKIFKKTSINKLNKLKEGQRGIIFGVNKSDGSGHVFNVVNQKGTIRYLDGQTGKAADPSKYKNLFLLLTKE